MTLVLSISLGFALITAGFVGAVVYFHSRHVATQRSVNRLSALHTDLVRQVGIMHSDQAHRIVTSEEVTRSLVAKRYGDLRELIDATSENYGLRFEGISERLISLETENKTTAPVKKDEDDDPYAGARSWSAQAANAERGAGVRSNA